jgi:hypothetical protein
LDPYTVSHLGNKKNPITFHSIQEDETSWEDYFSIQVSVGWEVSWVVVDSDLQKVGEVQPTPI